MPDYQKMYHRLFRSQTDAIELLQKAQQDTEELYMSSPDPDIKVLEPKKPNDSGPDQKNDQQEMARFSKTGHLLSR